MNDKKIQASSERMGTPIYDGLVRHNNRRWLRTTVRWTLAITVALIAGGLFGAAAVFIAR